MKDYNKCRIQFMFGDYRNPEDIREVWWRIQPSELGFWDRLFRNPWRTLKRHIYGEMTSYFTPMKWKEELSHLKTYADVIRYQRDEYHKYRDYIQEKVELGVYWPR